MQEAHPQAEPADIEFDISDADPRQLAALELLRRRRARASLVEYARSVDIPGVPISDDPTSELFLPVETALALHHRVMLEAIERTVRTPFGRLMIFAPPGSAKSSYASVVTPSWCLSRFPGYRVIMASYNHKQAARQSRRARALVRSPRHVSIWQDRPTLNGDQRAVDEWALSNASTMMAAGFQSGITGNRANGIVIDDPFKNREEADSPTMREKVENEYQDSVKTRLLPGAWIIAIFTRWHPLDLGGMLLPDDYDGRSGKIRCKDGQEWEILNIPAKCEREDDPLGREIGEYLWTDYYPERHWQQFENDPRGARTWSALYQQRPNLGEGLEFKREWFKWFDPAATPGAVNHNAMPAELVTYMASDYATLEDKGDFTEHGVLGVDKSRHFWLIDWWYKQATTDVTIGQWAAMCAKHRPRRYWHEGGPIGNAIGPVLADTMRQSQPAWFTNIRPLPSIKNKAIKLNALQKVAAEGRLHLPLNTPWATRLVDQLCAFPATKYDDAADCAGLLARGIDDMLNPYESFRESRKIIKPFTAEWLEMDWQGAELTPRFT